MFILVFIVIYIGIILCTVLSHVYFDWQLKKHESHIEKNVEYWNRIREKCREEKQYVLKKSVINQLRKPEMLAAFYETYSQIPKEEFLPVVRDNKEQMLVLAKKLKSTTMRAYFAYIVSTLSMNEAELSEGFDDMMLEYILDDSVYIRENALKALYSFGNAKKVSKAFELLSERKLYHSEKLLTDGLMAFKGDARELFDSLMAVFDQLMECFQVSVINALSYCEDYTYNDDFVQRLYKDETSSDIKCSVIRILGKVKGEENKEHLLFALGKYQNEEAWEPAAVSAGALGRYAEDEEVMKALCIALTSKNWYVRMNSAKSLARIDISQEYIQKVMDGTDKYAKNALEYVMNR